MHRSNAILQSNIELPAFNSTCGRRILFYLSLSVLSFMLVPILIWVVQDELENNSEEEAFVVDFCRGDEGVFCVGGGDEFLDFGEHIEGDWGEWVYLNFSFTQE